MKTLFFALSTVLVCLSSKAKSLPNPTRIVNGQDAEHGQFPYQAAIFVVYGTFSDIFIFTCGGNLIKPNWVLTAAHCLDDDGTYDVHLGALDIFNIDEPGRVSIRSSKVIIHKDYDGEWGIGNDIGLIQLATAVELSDVIQLVNLPNKSDGDFVNEVVIASGWGATGNEDDERLQFASLRVITNGDCGKEFGIREMPDDIICGHGENNESACFGDSGGPLVLKSTQVLVGIANFVHKNGCFVGKPVGFARVVYFLDWIAENME